MTNPIHSANIRQFNNANSKSTDAIEINGTRFSIGRLVTILGATTENEATASKKSLPVGRIFHPNETSAKKDATVLLFDQINTKTLHDENQTFVMENIAPTDCKKVESFLILANGNHLRRFICDVNKDSPSMLDFKIDYITVFSANINDSNAVGTIQNNLQHIINSKDNCYPRADTTEETKRDTSSFTGLHIRRHTKDFLNQGTLTGLNIRKNIKSLVTAKVNNEERNSSESERESFESGFF